MLQSVKDLQVLDPVVMPISVDVIDLFGGREFSTDVLFHDMAMEIHSNTIDSDPLVFLAGESSCSLSSGETFLSTELLFPNTTRGNCKGFPAPKTRCSKSNRIVRDVSFRKWHLDQVTRKGVV